jgi:pilus assembly protein CpaB
MTRRILAGVLALVLAVMAAVVVLAYARTADRRALAGQEAVSVYVAAEMVPAGTTAQQAEKEGLITKELIAAKAVPAGALTRIGERTANLRAMSDIVPGELVLSNRFAAEVPMQGTLAVPVDKLAVTVALPDPAKVGQFLRVGSRITVFDTFNIQEADTEDMTPAGDHLQNRHEFTRATRILLPDVEVLAIGQTTTKPDPQRGGPDAELDDAANASSTSMVTVTPVTVAVDQAEAEKLVHGVHTGTLYFGLRGADVEVATGPGVDDRRLFQEAVR